MHASSQPDSAPLGFESRRPNSDPVIEAYKADVDRSLVREMLKLTPEERLLALERTVEDAVEMRRAMATAIARDRR